MLTSAQIDTAITNRARVQISPTHGWAAGTIGIAMGYNNAYGTIKVGFIDADGKYTGDYTKVSYKDVSLVPETPENTPTYRWIMYLHNPLGGFDVERHTTLTDTKQALIEYGRNTGFYQDLQVGGQYGCSGSLYPYTEQNWADALEFKTSGCPFDYPSKLVENGPRGGVRITNA